MFKCSQSELKVLKVSTTLNSVFWVQEFVTHSISVFLVLLLHWGQINILSEQLRFCLTWNQGLWWRQRSWIGQSWILSNRTVAFFAKSGGHSAMMTLSTDGAMIGVLTSQCSCGGRTPAHRPGSRAHRPGISCALGLHGSVGGLYWMRHWTSDPA